MNLLHGGYWHVEAGLYACAPAKCGSMTLRQSLFGTARLADVLAVITRERRWEAGPYTPWQVAGLPGRKVLAIRDPVQRFASLWRDKCAKQSRLEPELYRLTPMQLMDCIEAFPAGNTHWLWQRFYAVPGVEMVSFEQLLAALGRPTCHINRSPVVENMPALPVARIRRFYAQDAEAWERVKNGAS